MSETKKIAIIDDEKDMRESIAQWLTLSGYKTETFSSAREALGVVDANYPGIVISDIRMPEMDGIEFLKRLHRLDRSLPVILITGHGDVAMAVECMRIGAYDFLEKPFDPERMADLSKRALQTRHLMLENRNLRRELSDEDTLARRLVGSSNAMTKLREDILDLSQTDGHLLITGESGTGKSLIAHAIHACGARQGTKYLTVNATAHTEDAFNQLLFDASEYGASVIDQAIGGTLCIEGIESLSHSTQSRLLERLEEQDQNEDNALRIISISSEVEKDNPLEEKLRKEFYYRISSKMIEVPPLRDRSEDILPLFNRYLEKFGDEYGLDPFSISAKDAAALTRASWPGNLRQLINLAERVVLQRRQGDVSIAELLEQNREAAPLETPDGQKLLKEQVESFERMLIDSAMRRHHGSIQNVLEELGLPRRTLNEKMAKYSLSRSDYTG